MNREEIEQSKDPDIRVVAQCLRTHVGEDRPGQEHAQKRGCPEKGGAMASVKMVALPKQAGLGLAESIENAVGDVKQPGAQVGEAVPEEATGEDAWRGRRTRTREQRRLAHRD